MSFDPLASCPDDRNWTTTGLARKSKLFFLLILKLQWEGAKNLREQGHIFLWIKEVEEVKRTVYFSGMKMESLSFGPLKGELSVPSIILW